MPAQVENMFSVRAMPWHRQGTVLEDYPQTFAEARKLAGLDWDPVALPVVESVVTRSQLHECLQDIVRESATMPVVATVDRLESLWDNCTQSDSEWRRIARDDTGETLSYQRDSYTVIPNSAFGEIIDSVLAAEPGTVKLETGGCLAGGRKVWMLARLDEPHQVTARGRTDSSVSFPYLGITSSHDGKASCAARLTEIRIICANTYSLAEAEGQRTGAVYSFSHRSGWRDRIGEAREALQFARNENREYIAAMSDLLGITITPEQEKLWLRAFIPAPPDGLVSDRVARNIEEARAAVQGFLDGPAVEGAGIRGTAYGLVQAAGEYLDHVRVARSWESRLNRSLLKAEPLKAKAAELARVAASM